MISRLKSLINTSLFYSKDEYEKERLVEMQNVLTELIKTYATNLSETEIKRYFASDVGYVTPKVDIRAVIFNDKEELLLVQEKSDGRWALPGGWADVGYSPSEIAEKEAFEEAGINVTAQKLIKIVDKAKHPYPKSLEYVYKFFILCEAENFEVKIGLETSAVAFVKFSEIKSKYSLSLERNNEDDIQELFDFYHNPWELTQFD